MPHVVRNESGAVLGLLRWPQQNGQEFLPDDRPNDEAFRSPPPPADIVDARIAANPAFAALVQVVAERAGG